MEKMSTLKLCEKYFETKDIYELFELEKDASDKAIKKAYYKMSLKVHPDRVVAEEKETATEKFKLLSKLYQVLTDKAKRAIYDENGTIDDDDGDLETSWMDLWRSIFKPLTDDDISNYEKSYIGSELERTDMKKAYLSGKGCINHMMTEVPFLRVEDEPRMRSIIGELIDSGELPDYDSFTKEPSQKRNRRHKKYARESRESEEIKKRMAARNGGGGNRSIMDHILQKYGGDDSSDPISLDALGSSGYKKKKNGKGKKAGTKATAVKEGRVHKRKN